MSFNWCKPVCEKTNDSQQKTACLHPKGSLLHPKSLWEERNNARNKAIWAGVLVGDTERSKSHDCWVTNCTSLHKLSATLPSNTLSSFWWWTPLMKLSQRRHNLAFIYFRGFFQLGLFRAFWGGNLSASKSTKERKKPQWWWSEVIHLEWQCPRGTHLFLLKNGWVSKKQANLLFRNKVTKKISCCIRVSASHFKEAGIVKRDFKLGRVC